MRFAAAIVSFVLAFVMIGFGIAQRTIFAEPDNVVASTQLDNDATVTFISGQSLNAFEGLQRVKITGDDTITAVYGRQSDVLAWIGDTSYTELKSDAETGELDSDLIYGVNKEVPSALGSDLWLGEFSGDSFLDLSLRAPEDVGLLIMSDGVEAAPSRVSITWPVETATPWFGPLIVGGVFFLVLGVVLYLLALRHIRKTRGPRRTPPKGEKQPRLPSGPRYSPRKTAKAVRPGAAKPIENPRGRRALSRQMGVAVPLVLVSALALSACSSSDWPDLSANFAPSPSASTAAAPATTVSAEKPTAVTPAQLERIMSNIATVTSVADSSLNAEQLATRFEGPAYEVRAANYTKRAADAAVAPLPAINGEPIGLSLPQQTDAWPRSVLTVVQDPDDETVVPMALMLVQDTPRDNYKVQYAVQLQATEFPDVAASSVGAVRYSGENKFLKMAPEQVALAYADILAVGAESEYAEEFDLESDTFWSQAGPEGRQARAAAVSGPAALTTTSVAGSGDRIALATDNTGAILTLSFGDKETIAPTETGATITVGNEVKQLTGVSETKTGVYAVYGYQLLFYVPPVGSDEKIRLLGATQGITSAGQL